MDRDMVNCLHYLYQWGQITASQLHETDPRKTPFWCQPDTEHPLKGRDIVFEDGQTGSLKLAAGVYDLIDMIEDQLRSMPRPDYAFGYPISAAIRTQGSTRPAFLAISYAPEFEPVKLAVREAAVRAGFCCEVTGDLEAPGDIMDQVWLGIRGADVVVADITGNNPNVFYEIGLAHALGKEVILISQHTKAPFDIRPKRRVTYDSGDLEGLKTRLAAAFGAISARYPHEGQEPKF
jgi:hypothetical protein